MKEKLKCYLVGGAVRDRLLHRASGDRDWVVVGSNDSQMRSLGFLRVGKNFPVYLHPETKEEYALARKDAKVGSGHTGFVVDANPGITLEEDLYRRDLTINAIAEDQDGRLIDPFNGLKDIKNRVLRHVSDAFIEDPLRVFRVARLAAQLPDFSLAEETKKLMTAMSQRGDLSQLSAERVWSEMNKNLNSVSPERFFLVLDICEGLADWLPELKGNQLYFTQGDAIDRYCELNLTKDSFEALGMRLKPPKNYLIASRYWCSYSEIIKNWRQTSQSELYDCLEKMKIFHDKSHIERMLKLAERHGSHELETLRAHIESLISFESKVNQKNLNGPEIGSQMRAQRINRLKQLY